MEALPDLLADLLGGAPVTDVGGNTAEDTDVVATRPYGALCTRLADPTMGVESVEATDTVDPPSHPKRKDGMIKKEDSAHHLRLRMLWGATVSTGRT